MSSIVNEQYHGGDEDARYVVCLFICLKIIIIEILLFLWNQSNLINHLIN